MRLDVHVPALREGAPVTFKAHGNSMQPRVMSGDVVTVAPVDPAEVAKGDVVLAKVRGQWYLHLVSATEPKRVQISNNRGYVNGWTARTNVVGRLLEGDAR